MSDEEFAIDLTFDPRVALRAWQIEPRSIRRTEMGVNNQTFEVEAEDGRFYLRIYSSEIGRDRIRYEQELLLWLQTQSLTFAVPAPMATSAGETFAAFDIDTVSEGPRSSDAEGRRRYAALFAAIPGRHRQWKNRSQVESAGRSLGSLHLCLSQSRGLQVPGNFAANGQPGSFHPAVTDPLEMAKTLPDGTGTLARTEAVIGRVLDSAPALYDRLPIQVIHGDFYAGNILFNGDLVSGVLDFEFVRSDIRVFDFVAGLDSFCFRRGNKDFDRKSAAAFSRGYAYAIKQTSGEIEALPELVRYRAVRLLVHCTGRWREGRASEADVRRAIMMTLTLEDWLSASSTALVRLVRESSQG